MNETDYYIPLTINEFIDGLNGIVKKSKDLTGQEFITDIEFIDKEGDCDVPPGSIAIFLKQGTLNPDESKYGTIVLTPGKSRRFM